MRNFSQTMMELSSFEKLLSNQEHTKNLIIWYCYCLLPYYYLCGITAKY
jgi:hypothetical protein